MDESPSTAAPIFARQSFWQRVRPWLNRVFFVLALSFLGALLARQWQELRAFAWHIEPLWLAPAFGLLWLTWLLELNQWRFILRRLGGQLPYFSAARIWFLSNLARYVPGNIWQFVGMAEMAAGQGVARMATLTSIVLHQAVSTLAGLCLATIFFAAFGQGAWLDQFRVVLWFVPLSLVFLHPRVLQKILNTALRFLKRPPLVVTLTVPDLFRLFFAYLAVWIGFGVAFACLTRAFTPILLVDVATLVAAYAAAYVIGYLSLLTPSGLGVREGVLALLLAPPLLAAPLPVMIALAARIWMTLGELGAALIVIFTGRGRKKQPAEPTQT